MADRIAAEIWIGGKLPRSLLDEFPVSDLCLDWDGNRLQSSAEADILAARNEDGLLHFAEVEAAWGEFEELEGWLQEHNIPFRRQSEGKYEYDACIVEFRPDLKGKENRDTLTTRDGKPVVRIEEIEKIVESMAKLVADRKRPATKRLQAWERLYRKLLRAVPFDLPPLPPFEIVND
ncbi:MAG TPA: hypothetical protein VMY42_23830 [Thermoguttaceae bacterium]|nr:hypothetical protein [Thermoguttaceae bacterium]